MISGLDFISKISILNASTKPHTAYALTLPLVTTSKGSKLGKSAGNAVWLGGPFSSAYDVLQVKSLLAKIIVFYQMSRFAYFFLDTPFYTVAV